MQSTPETQSATSATTYWLTYFALMTLLALTCGAAFIDLGALNLVVAIGIAVAKMLLVVLFFMHVRTSPRLVWLFAVAGIFWLMILFGLMLSDYFSRGWPSLVNR